MAKAVSIRYNGPADIRVLGKVDFAKSGVNDFDQADIWFKSGVSVQVPTNVKKAVLDNPDLYGDFTDGEAAETDDDDEVLDATAATAGAKKSTSTTDGTGSTSKTVAQ